jgi:hypothetical protein
LAVVGGAALLALFAPPPAAGQDPTPHVTTQVPTLEQALARVAWDSTRRGALLVVDPANTRLAAGPSDTLPPAAPRPGSNHLLRDVAAAFGRKIARGGSVTVLAPTTMVVLNERPGKPDLLAGATRDEKIRMLLASLSPGQWRLLGASAGAGWGAATCLPTSAPFTKRSCPTRSPCKRPPSCGGAW